MLPNMFMAECKTGPQRAEDISFSFLPWNLFYVGSLCECTNLFAYIVERANNIRRVRQLRVWVYTVWKVLQEKYRLRNKVWGQSKSGCPNRSFQCHLKTSQGQLTDQYFLKRLCGPLNQTFHFYHHSPVLYFSCHFPPCVSVITQTVFFSNAPLKRSCLLC